MKLTNLFNFFRKLNPSNRRQEKWEKERQEKKQETFEQVAVALTEALSQTLEERQKRPNQFIVGYYQTVDSKLIGYHLSSSCQVTQDRLKAKRYSSDNPYHQLEVINKNLNYVLSCTEENPGFFGYSIKLECFPNYKPGDIYLEALYLEEDEITPQSPTIIRLQ